MPIAHFGSVHVSRIHRFNHTTLTQGTTYGLKVSSTEEDSRNGQKPDGLYVDLRSNFPLLSPQETALVSCGNDTAAQLTRMVDEGIPDQEAFTEQLNAFAQEITGEDTDMRRIMNAILKPSAVQMAIKQLQRLSLRYCTTVEDTSKESVSERVKPSFEVRSPEYFPLTK